MYHRRVSTAKSAERRLLSADLFAAEPGDHSRSRVLPRGLERATSMVTAVAISGAMLFVISNSLHLSTSPRNAASPAAQTISSFSLSDDASAPAQAKPARVENEKRPLEWEIVSLTVPVESAQGTGEKGAQGPYDPYARPSQILKIALRDVEADAVSNVKALAEVATFSGQATCTLAIARRPHCAMSDGQQVDRLEQALAPIADEILRHYQRRKIEVSI